ncbi:hypothetical protein [Actinoallomurus sp. CA-142502]|uniref:hypothetical protein n=1 Tax=Actinoallomurus sp. CA-142502 TaxID=3239885 RepID=UPI003D907219
MTEAEPRNPSAVLLGGWPGRLGVSCEPSFSRGLHRRREAELFAEELRRLEPDDVYREALQGWPRSVVVRGPLSMI